MPWTSVKVTAFLLALHEANFRKIKKGTKHAGAPFFSTLFFQDKDGFDSRIHYVPGDGLYEEAKAGDTEAASLIDFLGFNDNVLYEERADHVRMLKDLFKDARYEMEAIRNWFVAHPQHLSFVTAIEAELGIDLSSVLQAEN